MPVAPAADLLLEQASAISAELAAKLASSEENRYQGMPSDADSRHVYERLGQANLIGLHWPVALGGRGLDPLQTVTVEEAFGYHWLPLSGYLLSVKTIGNAFLRFAAPDLVDRLLPQIASGSLIFCQGFSEPDAGSDLAAIRTRAALDGERFIVNGRKLWTSSAEIADWVYLAVRTDPDAPRHRGLSVLVADMRSPGIEVASHATLGGGTLGELVLEDLEVPADQMVGDLHGGWPVLMGTMDFERITSEKVGVALWLLDNLRSFAASAADRQELRRLYGEARAARLHGQHATALLAAGNRASAACSMAKLSVAKLMQAIASFSVNLLGPAALIERGPEALLGGRIAAFHRAAVATTIAGGASDIQRRVIARHGFGVM